MKLPIIISIIWLAFALIFGKLCWSHWEKSKQEIPKFKITKVLGGGTDIKRGGVSIEKPFQDFANDFNNYLEQQNKSNFEANRNAAFGYFVASLTSLFAVVLEWVSYISKRKSRILQKN